MRIKKEDLLRTMRLQRTLKGPKPVTDLIKIIKLFTNQSLDNCFDHLLRIWLGVNIMEQLFRKNIVSLVIQIMLCLNWPEASLTLMMMDPDLVEELKERFTIAEWLRIWWHNSKTIFSESKCYLRSAPCWTDSRSLPPISITRLKNVSVHQMLWDYFETTSCTSLSIKFKRILFSEDWILRSASYSHQKHIVALYLQQNKLIFVNYLRSNSEGQILHVYEPPDGKILADFSWSPNDQYFACFICPVWSSGHFNMTSIVSETLHSTKEKIILLFSLNYNAEITIIKRIQTNILYKADIYKMSSFIWNGSQKFILYDVHKTLTQHQLITCPVEGKKLNPKYCYTMYLNTLQFLSYPLKLLEFFLF